MHHQNGSEAGRKCTVKENELYPFHFSEKKGRKMTTQYALRGCFNSEISITKMKGFKQAN